MLINICVFLAKICYIILENVKYKEKLFIIPSLSLVIIF